MGPYWKGEQELAERLRNKKKGPARGGEKTRGGVWANGVKLTGDLTLEGATSVGEQTGLPRVSRGGVECREPHRRKFSQEGKDNTAIVLKAWKDKNRGQRRFLTKGNYLNTEQEGGVKC